MGVTYQKAVGALWTMSKEAPKFAIFCSVMLTRPRCHQANKLEPITMQCPVQHQEEPEHQKRANYKAHKLTNLLQVIHLPFTSFSTKFLKDNCVVFDASHNKHHIDIRKDAIVIVVSKLKIIDTTMGARLLPVSEADAHLFVLVPTEEVVGSGKQVDISSLIPALETLESNNKVSLECGKSRYVGHASDETMYTYSGVAPNHGGKGTMEGVDKVNPKG